MNEFEKAKIKFETKDKTSNVDVENPIEKYAAILCKLTLYSDQLLRQFVTLKLLAPGSTNFEKNMFFDTTDMLFFNISKICEKSYSTIKKTKEKKYNCTLKYLEDLSKNELKDVQFRFIKRSVLLERLRKNIYDLEEFCFTDMRNACFAHHSVDAIFFAPDEYVGINIIKLENILNQLAELLNDFWYSLTGIRYPYKTANDYLLEYRKYRITYQDDAT